MAEKLAHSESEKELLVCTFVLGNEGAFGIDATSIQEVVMVGEITPVRHAPAFVAGIRNLRGRIVTVIDLCVRLGLGSVRVSPESRVLIADWKGEPVGLLVDRVAEAVVLEPGGLERAPSNLSVGKCRSCGACSARAADWPHFSTWPKCWAVTTEREDLRRTRKAKERSVRVLVADDSVLFRRLIGDVLSTFPGVEVIGSAANGKIALQKVRELNPDVLTLDIEMPEFDGLAVLDALFSQKSRSVEVLVVSSASPRAGDLTVRALEKGAFDFIPKPEAVDPNQARLALIAELSPRIRALAHRLEIRSILAGSQTQQVPVAPAPTRSPETIQAGASLDGITRRMQRLTHVAKPDMVLIGVSTGGPQALAELLPALPQDIGVPVAIVQHMPPVFTKSLADSLALKCAIRVREAAHGEAIVANTAYIAPGGRQMRLEPGPEGQPLVHLSDDAPENNCRPAIDFLFRSAASRFPGRAIAVILTGMGNDGTLGLRLLKRHGCYAIAQDEASCVVYGMPKSVVDAGLVDAVLPIKSIACQIVSAIREGHR